MPRNPAQLLQEAMELPAEARAALADSLLESLDVEVDADAEQVWREEIEKRISSLEDGSAQTVSWEEVQARLVDQLKR